MSDTVDRVFSGRELFWLALCDMPRGKTEDGNEAARDGRFWFIIDGKEVRPSSVELKVSVTEPSCARCGKKDHLWTEKCRHCGYEVDENEE